MGETYIRIDPTTRIVTFVHHRPFDPVNGLNATRDELLKTGFFVDNYPEPQPKMGKRAVAYYDHERKAVYYEYQTLPLSEKTRLDMMEDAMNNVLLRSSNVTSQRKLARRNVTPDNTNATIEEENKMNGLAKYLAHQIYTDKLNKDEVFATYPDLIEDIEKYLDEWNVIPVINDIASEE